MVSLGSGKFYLLPFRNSLVSKTQCMVVSMVSLWYGAHILGPQGNRLRMLLRKSD